MSCGRKGLRHCWHRAPFIVESHTQALRQRAFDILGHEVMLSPSTRQTYRVAAIIVHSKARQHYTTLAYADSGLAYSYDNLLGLKLVYRDTIPVKLAQHAEYLVSFQALLQ